MADKPFHKTIDVRGNLDTAMPITDRPPGTLISAYDVNPRQLGPRVGNKAFTRAWESSGTASLYDAITLLGTSGVFASGQNFEDQFRDLGTKFTLDIWFRMTAITTDSAQLIVGLYDLQCGASGAIHVCIRGPAHADHEKIHVGITTSTDRTTPATIVNFTGSTRLTASSAQTGKHHIRVVRDGATATLYLDGVSDGSTSSLSATNAINGALGTTGDVSLLAGDSVTAGFKGSLYGCWLRDGAFSTLPITARMPCAPWARNVHHAYLGRDFSLGGGQTHFFDAGRYGVHARVINGALATDYTVTSSNDDSAPAPSPVQAIRTWTTRTNRTASSAACGGVLSSALIS